MFKIPGVQDWWVTRLQNGRWWRTPSFSVEDLIKYAGVMVPLIGFFFMIWLDVRDIKRALPGLATKAYVANLVVQGSVAHEGLNHRVSILEGKPYVPLPPIRAPRHTDEVGE